ncbi:MAG: glutamate racemase [bacterium]
MIGIFDSGVGGLTVLREIHKKLPEHSTVYLGDSARAPYGDKSHDEITRFTWEGVRWLFDRGCPLVILACNSASAQALRTIQQTKLDDYPGRRVLGVIRPTVEELADRGYAHIGILATPATVKSEAYVKELKNINPDIHVTQHAASGWVDLVEAGKAKSDEARNIVKADVNALLDDCGEIDAVLLGCTHYPVLYDTIRQILPKEIDLFDQGPIVAEKLVDYLNRHPDINDRLVKNADREYFTTGDANQARSAASQIAGFDSEFEHVKISSQ